MPERAEFQTRPAVKTGDHWRKLSGPPAADRGRQWPRLVYGDETGGITLHGVITAWQDCPERDAALDELLRIVLEHADMQARLDARARDLGRMTQENVSRTKELEAEISRLSRQEQWLGEAAAIVVSLAASDEPRAYHDHGLWPYCAICEGEARSSSGAIIHDSGCLWRAAKELVDRVEDRQP